MNKIAAAVVINLVVLASVASVWYQGIISIDAITVSVTVAALLICNGALFLGLILRQRNWPAPTKKPLLFFAIGLLGLIDGSVRPSTLMLIASLGIIALGVLTLRQQRRDGKAASKYDLRQ